VKKGGGRFTQPIPSMWPPHGGAPAGQRVPGTTHLRERVKRDEVSGEEYVP